MKEIPIFGGLVALVDDEDYERLRHYNWFARKSKRSRTTYAVRNLPRCAGVKKQIFMHRQILGLDGGHRERTDHRDHNGLNNQKYNLRVASAAQNNYNMPRSSNNTSGYKGVSFRSGKYDAYINYENRKIHLGRFSDPKEAAKAYDCAARKFHGEFANLNFESLPCS